MANPQLLARLLGHPFPPQPGELGTSTSMSTASTVRFAGEPRQCFVDHVRLDVFAGAWHGVCGQHGAFVSASSRCPKGRG